MIDFKSPALALWLRYTPWLLPVFAALAFFVFRGVIPQKPVENIVAMWLGMGVGSVVRLRLW